MTKGKNTLTVVRLGLDRAVISKKLQDFVRISCLPWNLAITISSWASVMFWGKLHKFDSNLSPVACIRVSAIQASGKFVSGRLSKVVTSTEYVFEWRSSWRRNGRRLKPGG